MAIIQIPIAGADQQPEGLLLRCEVLVLRVEAQIASSGYGIACQIVNYSVLRCASTALGT